MDNRFVFLLQRKELVEFIWGYPNWKNSPPKKGRWCWIEIGLWISYKNVNFLREYYMVVIPLKNVNHVPPNCHVKPPWFFCLFFSRWVVCCDGFLANRSCLNSMGESMEKERSRVVIPPLLEGSVHYLILVGKINSIKIFRDRHKGLHPSNFWGISKEIIWSQNQRWFHGSLAELAVPLWGRIPTRHCWSVRVSKWRLGGSGWWWLEVGGSMTPCKLFDRKM